MSATPDDIGRSPLGHATGYPDTYDPAQLFIVPRAPQRAALGLTGALPFSGRDVWTAYELTWLDPRGKNRGQRRVELSERRLRRQAEIDRLR